MGGALVQGSGWAYGLQLPIQTLTLNLVDPWEDDATVADLVRVAHKAESTGHSFVGVCDHVAVPDDEYSARMRTTWYDTVATLGFLAAQTTSVKLLSVVWIAAYRHPLQTASSFGTLDHLSGGRVILGVGAGHVAGEFAALDVPFEERGAILDETLEALSTVFDDKYASFSGERFNYSNVGVSPRPPDGGRLSTWIGGNSKAAWRRVGKYGDGYIPMGNSIDQYGEIISTIRQSAEANGRGDAPIDIGYMPGWVHLTGSWDDEGLPPAMITGVEAYAEDIRAARAAGANVIHVKFRGRSLAEYLEQFDAFVEEVVPLVDEG
jgi:probable F420-dependent oxidoreductase